MSETFTPADYDALIEGFRARGYVARDFFGVERAARHLVLRHDIDVSLEAALEMAEREAALGLRATYFVLLRSELYNPFAPAGLGTLRRLRALGHEVGLHFDAGLIEGGLEALDAAAEEECALLERLIEAPVRIISLHRPAPELLGYDRPLGGRAHAYEPRFFRGIAYCSDSRGTFRHGHPLDHPAVAAGQALQLLIHPIWWSSLPGSDVTGRLEGYLAARLAALRGALAATVETYRAGAS